MGLLVPELFKTDASKVDGKQIICTGHYEQRTKDSKIQGVLEMPINTGGLAVCQRVRDNEKIWKQLSNYPGVRHDDFLNGLVTLFEQTVKARELYTSNIQDISINGIPLKVNNLSDKVYNPRSYLADYNPDYYE